jgi:hypothetical protein
MNARRFAPYQFALVTVTLFGLGTSSIYAQDGHTHGAAQTEPALTLEQQAAQNTLLKAVRDATERFKDVSVAKQEGYALQFGCVTGSDSGAMGLHYVNGTLVNSGILDAAHPQIVIYEPMPDGSLKLIGADFLVIADTWNASHSEPPQLMGQLFHLFESPNRFGLPAFYTLHVWAWKHNPQGTFTNWHPNVSCASFATQNQ